MLTPLHNTTVTSAANTTPSARWSPNGRHTPTAAPIASSPIEPRQRREARRVVEDAEPERGAERDEQARAGRADSPRQRGGDAESPEVGNGLRVHLERPRAVDEAGPSRHPHRRGRDEDGGDQRAGGDHTNT